MATVKALVLTGYGLNCDAETAYAFKLAGADPHRVHINALIEGSVKLSDYQVLAFGGGFGWGDDHGAGVIQAVKMKTHLGQALIEFVGRGRLVIGICNGFQALVNLGLLPGLDGDYRSRRVALTFNESGNFRDDWVALGANADSPCVFTRGMAQIELPVRHGEGKFVADPETIDRLNREHLVALRYIRPDGHPAENRFPFNPNGSIDDIAGICDPTGRVFGLMPHPEAYNHFTNHPHWTLHRERQRRGSTGFFPETAPGIRVFRNAVAYLNAG